MAKSHCYFIATSARDRPISQHFRALSRELVERGHRVVILVDHQKKEVESHETNPAYYTWPSWRPTKIHDAIFFTGLIRKYRPDCLIANFGSVNIMMVVGWLMGVSCRVAWYHTLSTKADIDCERPQWKLKLLRFRKQMVYKLASYLIANSEAARKDAQCVFRVSQNKCHVFYNALLDSKEKANLHQGTQVQERPRIVCVGRLELSKGQDVLIKALSYLKESVPDAYVEFIGDGAYKEYYLKLAHDLGVESMCKFLGTMSHKEALKKIASALIGVVPSRAEAFGLVNIEFISMGIPVVASSTGGIPEIIRDGVDGFLVSPDNPKALAEKLKILLQKQDLRETMSENARQHFLNKFEQNKAIKEQADWFEKILKSGRR